jgi:class 3 adenylate cyclase/tetratricopeptide (TPR) repeat protein
MVRCWTCGHENPDDARFCMKCGSPLEGEQPAAREERKVVTVFFADLVGFTGRAEQLDPEDVRAMLSPYYARLRSEIERFGGTVEKFIGDAVMAVFGAPVTHEDDPERAVRAALAARDAVQELNDADPSLDLHVRIAVNTGEAVVALDLNPSGGEGMVAGDVVNTASRLQTAAPVDGILVGETTYRATERVVEYRECEPVQAKGKTDPIPVWEALGARARYGVDVFQRGGADLVGRGEELDWLTDGLARTLRERRTQLVTLVGVPGIGKSRLVWELAQAVDTDPELIVYWRQGRSLPYGEGVAFWAVGEMVKAQAGILETDSAEAAEAKLHETVADLIPDEESAQWIEGHLRPLVGITGEADSSGDRRDEAFAAWRRFFEALAEQRPLVLVFEDLHWADDVLLDFVDHLVDWVSEAPLLVIGTARPELLERRPGWGGGKSNAATVSLAPLSEEETARLFAALLGQTVMPAELQAPLLARAGGNPLYAEEYARMVSERGMAPADGALPETVQGIVAARLDALSPEDKALIQDAAVLGKVFWSGALAAMTGLQRWTVEEHLHRLERKEFVRRERRTSVATETEYAFRHVLVRDVAYGQVPRADRAEKHSRAAEWIEALSSDREDRVEMLAHHYLSALEFARAAGQDVGSLADRARLALREAGDRAYGLSAWGAAVRFYREALELWPENDADRGMLLFRYGQAVSLHDAGGAGGVILEEARDVLLVSGAPEQAAMAEVALVDAHWFSGAPERARRHLQRAVELIDGAPPSRPKAFVLSQIARFAMLSDEDARAIDVAQETLAMIEEVGGSDELRAQALNVLGTSKAKLGDRDGLKDLEQSIEITQPGSYERLRGYINLGSTLSELGELPGSFEAQEQGFREAERFGSIRSLRWLQAEFVVNAFYTGRWDEAMAGADDFIDMVGSGQPHYMEAAVRNTRGLIRFARGDHAGALTDSEYVIAVTGEVRDPQIVHPALAAHSRTLLAAGRPAEAARFADELLELLALGKTGIISYWGIPLAVVLSSLGRADELEAAVAGRTETRWQTAALAYAAGELEASADLLDEIGAVVDAAYARMRAAEAYAAEGRRPEADAQLQQALAVFRSVGAAAWVNEAEALFAASA